MTDLSPETVGKHIRGIARRVKAGRLDAGPRTSFETYNGRGGWGDATDSERQMERDSFAAALRAIAKEIR